MVPRLEPRKAVGRLWRAQVVSLGLAVPQKGLADDTADAVETVVGGVNAAASITKPSGHRFTTANLKRRAQHVEGCFRLLGSHRCLIRGRTPVWRMGLAAGLPEF